MGKVRGRGKLDLIYRNESKADSRAVLDAAHTRSMPG